MKLQGTVVLLTPEENLEKTDKGIIIPKTIKDKPNFGIVVDVADGCTQLKAGDKVRYNRKSANIAHVNGVEYHFINEGQAFYIEK